MNITNKMSEQVSSYYVVKRNGRKQPIYFDKITTRLSKLLDDNMKNNVNIIDIVKKTIESIVPGITTHELDEHSAYHCASMATTHHDYMLLAGRILISSLHKETLGTFVEKMEYIQENLSLFDPKWIQFIQKNRDVLNSEINYENDYRFDFFGFKTMERTYIIKHDGKIIERPQDVFMRVASLVHCGNIEKTIQSYTLMSKNYFTHASPTLFNAGNKNGNLVSCFLLGTEDSIEGITKTWSDVSSISKWGGGIGIHVSNIRSKGSKIRSTNGQSDGIIPMLQVYNSIARYVNQSGKRRGSFAIYLEPHHADIIDFLELRKNTGAESERARDLFLALWVSDLFMKQVEKDADWYLMCPDECPRLNDTYAEEYENLYWSYVEEGKFRQKMKARKLWDAIMTSQFETGSPYILYKDNINKCSNQKNIGIIRSSNLCAEIVEYSDANETAACNLASISLSAFTRQKKLVVSNWKIYTLSNCPYCNWAKNILKYNKIDYEEIKVIKGDDTYLLLKEKHTDSVKLTFPLVYQDDNYIGGMEELYVYLAKEFDYETLWQTAYHVTENLNQVIDKNVYPTVESRRSNVKHRPIGLGVQGLADVFAMLRIPYGSPASLRVNQQIFAVIYHASLSASCDIAISRESGMQKLITYFKENRHVQPTSEFYDANFRCENKEIENLYHSLTPCREELNIKRCFGAYSSFVGSPFSEGKLQYHLWGVKPVDISSLVEGKDWDSLLQKIKTHGTRNSLLTALMPTASTSQLLGNYESFEPFTSNLYTRKTLAGEFVVVNKHLIQDLTELGVWNSEMKNEIMATNGSVQDLEIPKLVKNIYLTAYEMKQKCILDGCITRGPYIDQTQSMNLYFPTPDSQKLTSSQFYAWKRGLKTGIYYLRSKAAGTGAKIGIRQKHKNSTKEEEETCIMCSA